jgi:hypothetical protein
MLAASPILKRHGGTIIECREDGWHAPNSQPNAALLLPGTNPASIPQVQTRREQAEGTAAAGGPGTPHATVRQR